MGRGSLTIVGSGIRAGAETTPEARASICAADKVFYLVADALTAEWIESLNPSAESLADDYLPDVRRSIIYATIVDRILIAARQQIHVCVAFYGHPGVFVYPGHESIRRARREGIEARMLPGISAADRLFADLGIDPGAQGLQTYEATGFLVYGYQFDARAALVLWQIGALGNLRWTPDGVSPSLDALAEYLLPHYGPRHEVFVYEAARDPVSESTTQRMPLSALVSATVTFGSTLYVPPIGEAKPSAHMLRKLNISVLDWNM